MDEMMKVIKKVLTTMLPLSKLTIVARNQQEQLQEKEQRQKQKTKIEE